MIRRVTPWAAPLALSAAAVTAAAAAIAPLPPATTVALSSAAPAMPGGAGGTPRPATYDVIVERNVPLRMSDGVRLVADVRRPARDGAPVPGRFPVIVTQTAYNKTLPGFDMASDYLVQRGYVQVIVDVRGTGGSEGHWDAFGPRENKDGKEIVEWAAARGRPWSDGRVGLYGSSYGGINQIFTAAQHPKGLKAIMPVVAAGDIYRDLVGTGGRLGTGFMPLWLALVSSTSLLPPTYSATDPGAALRALAQHAGNIPAFQVAMVADALAGGPKAYDGPFYRERSPLEVIDRVNVPAFLVGGEFDIFQRGEPLLYQRLAARGVPATFLYGPWYHMSGLAGLTGITLPGFPTPPDPGLPARSLRWYDHYVRGVADPALDAAPPVTYFENGAARWHDATAWPPGTTRYRALRLSGDPNPVRPGTLTWDRTAAKGGPDLVPWLPVAGLCARSAVQWTAGILAYFGLPCEDDDRANDLLGAAYDLPVTGRPLHLAGTVGAHLTVSSPSRDGQLTVRLEDVAPDGKATQLTAGWQVLSLRALDSARTVRRDGLIVQPYHPYTKESARPMPAGRPATVDVEIFPVAASIPPGHRLRVSIQTGDFPHQLSPLPQQLDSAGPGLRIWHDAAHPSWIALPVS